jgi:hypothetical protein
MLAPTSNAPIKNRLLMVVASKGGTPDRKTNKKRGARNDHAVSVPRDSNLLNWLAVKALLLIA